MGSDNLQLACVRRSEAIGPDVRALPCRSLKLIIITHSVTQSVPYVGIELLGQLKSSDRFIR